MCDLLARVLFDETLISVAGRVYTSIPGGSDLPQPTLWKTATPGLDTAIDTRGCKHTVVCPRLNARRDGGNFLGFMMATTGPAAAEQGTHTIHQTITCHYQVYAPTTVHVRSGEPRCGTESSSEAISASSHTTSVCQRPIHTNGTSTHGLKSDLEAIDTTKAEGKRQALLQWLIIKLVLLLQKVSQ